MELESTPRVTGLPGAKQIPTTALAGKGLMLAVPRGVVYDHPGEVQRCSPANLINRLSSNVYLKSSMWVGCHCHHAQHPQLPSENLSLNAQKVTKKGVDGGAHVVLVFVPPSQEDPVAQWMQYMNTAR